MSHLLYRLGRFSAGKPWLVIAIWIVAGGLVISLSGAVGQDLDDSFTVPGLDSHQAAELLTEAQSAQAGVSARVVVSPSNGETFADRPDSATALDGIGVALAELPNVVGVAPPVVSPDGEVALIQIQYRLLSELNPADLEQLEESLPVLAESSGMQVEAGGELFFAFDEPESGVGEAIGLITAVFVLLVAFGSVIAMGLPVGVALFGLALGVSSMTLVTRLIEIPAWAPQVGAMVGLGVGIDYALFLVTRHREFLADGLSVSDSVGRACATAGQAVVFAGGTVVVAILGLAVAGVPSMTGAGVATSIIVAIMVVATMTLVPAFLGLSGHWINRLSVGRRSRTQADSSIVAIQPSHRWHLWGRHVSRHAWPYAIGVTGLLLLLTAPVFALELGFPDEGTKSELTTERRAYDLVTQGFGPGANGPLLVAVDINGDDGVIEPLRAAISDDVGIVGVEVVDVNIDAGIATIVATPSTSPQDGETVETIERLRAEVLPTVLDTSAASAHVGGQTATFADVAGQVKDRLPAFIAAVVVLSFLLLMMVFRSVLVPLKAAILNLLSIGAAYGVLVAVFQWGWGLSLIGLDSTVPIVSFIPMFMFAILFGLSMDYEVFLLSRVREHFLATADSQASVIDGIAGTARVITSAALIMISVFGGFVLGSDPVTKMFGLGLATAIFVDATIVRIVLVPASMKLMGDANWWLPGWLDRILPTIDIEGEAALPPREYELNDELEPVVDVLVDAVQAPMTE